MNVNSSSIHDSQKSGNDPNVHQLITERNEVCLYNKVLFGNKKERSTDTCYKMNDPQRHDAKWKKSITRVTYFMIPFI